MTETETAPPRSGLFAGYALMLLLLANIFNYADRALLGIVVEPMRKELMLNDTEISIVSGLAFSVFFLLAGIAIARWVDRGNRRLILALGVALWSGATAATGWAQDFYTLALCAWASASARRRCFRSRCRCSPICIPDRS